MKQFLLSVYFILLFVALILSISILNNAFEMVRQPSDISVFIGFCLFPVWISFTYFSFSFLIKKIRQISQQIINSKNN